MGDEIRIPLSLPLDSDGFLRRECPNCEREFKWFHHVSGESDAEVVDQYFCPLCGVPAGPGSWWTHAQLEYAKGLTGPEMDRFVQEAVADVFRGVKGITYKPNRRFSLGTPDPEPLHEPDDMVIVEPPCHPNEPLKVSEGTPAPMHCLVCGAPFAA